jgi:hypothetical protein
MISHGEPTWRAGKGRVFATLDDHHHGASHPSVWLPAGLGAQEALVESDPERFLRPPYVGHRGWPGSSSRATGWWRTPNWWPGCRRATRPDSALLPGGEELQTSPLSGASHGGRRPRP